MKGRYAGRHMTIYGYILPGAISIADKRRYYFTDLSGQYLYEPGHIYFFGAILPAFIAHQRHRMSLYFI